MKVFLMLTFKEPSDQVSLVYRPNLGLSGQRVLFSVIKRLILNFNFELIYVHSILYCANRYKHVNNFKDIIIDYILERFVFMI